jgi:hypothetical protein
MFLLNGTPVQIDAPFTVGDINYPPGWLRFATPDARAALGIVEVPDPVRPDDRFFWIDERNVATPKDLAGLKDQWISQVKATAHVLLEETDWLVIREVEEPGTMKQDVKDYRKSVRSRSSEIEVAINACTDVAMLASFVTGDLNWPLTPEERTKRESQRNAETGKGARGTKKV